MQKSILLYIIAFLLLYGCSNQHTQNQERQEKTTDLKMNMNNCICVQLWIPVCGENGITYSNSCFAKCAGVKYKAGSCSKLITE